MPTIHVCGSEGEWSLFENTLDPAGADTLRRGSVRLTNGDQMFREYPATANLWVHARMASIGQGTFTDDQLAILTIRDAAGNAVFRLMKDGGAATTPNIALYYADGGNGVGLTKHGEVFPSAANEFYNYDINIETAASVTTVRFYRNEVLRFSATLTTALTTNPSQLLVAYGSNSLASDDVFVQDIIVTDDLPTVGMELATLVPAAAGAYFDFTNNYENVSDEGYNQSTVITSDAVAQRESWIYADPVFDLGDKVIYGVVTSTVAQADLAAVVTDFAPFLRIGAVNYAAADLGASSIQPNNFVSLWTINPATSQPWEESDLYGLEAGLLSK